MAFKNRYLFTKRTYPNYIVLFVKLDKYKSYGFDEALLEYINFKKLKDLDKLNINYIVLDNMNIIERKTFAINTYECYALRFNLFKLFSMLYRKVK